MKQQGTGKAGNKASQWGGILLAALLIFGSEIAGAQAPANDNFANRASLSGTSATMEGTVAGSTRETGEPAVAGDNVHGTVWWTWTAPTNGVVEIANLPGLPSYAQASMASVFQGDSLDTLQEVASDSGIWYSELFFKAVAGQTYQIAVTDYQDNSPKQVAMSLVLYDNPTNDNFADRIPIEIGVTNDFCNMFATMEPGEPPSPYGQRTLWWTWTAPKAGRLTIQRFYPTLGEVFKGTSVDALTDMGGGPFDVQPGDVLNLQVDEDSYPGNPPHGHVKFYAQFDAVPDNDNFTNRAILNGLPVEVDGTTALATSEAGEPAHLKQPPMNTVWYQWTAPSNCTVSALVDASWGTTVLTVYTGNSLSNLAQIAGGFYAGEPVTFKALGGRTYNIVIGTTYSAGPYHFAILGEPQNDDFANSFALTGWNAKSNSWTMNASVEKGEQRLTRFDSKQSIWWDWQAPYTGRADLSAASRNPVLLGVYTGEQVSRLQLQPFMSYHPANYVTTASFWATAGETYHIRASGLRSVQKGKVSVINGRVDMTVTANTLRVSSQGGQLTFNAPEAVTLDAETIADGLGFPPSLTFTVQKNENYVPFAATISGPPWEYTFTNLPPGLYENVAVSGTDTNGVEVFSSPISIRVKPVNDDFANRIPMPQAPSSANGSFAGSTIEPGEPKLSPKDTASMWHTWTPTNGGNYNVTVFAGNVGIYDGDSLANLQLLKSFTVGPNTFAATANHTYQIRGSTTGDPESSGSTYFAFFSQSQTNDAFLKRAVLTGTDAAFVSDNSSATTETGEPGPNGPSLWWTWQAPADGFMVLTRTNPASAIGFAVYTGKALKTLEPVSSVYTIDETNRNGIVVPVQAGTTYQITTYVPNNLGALPVPMNLHFAPLSTNDNFTNSIPVGTNFLLSGANYTATRETNEPVRSVGSTPVNATLWWQWTANTDGVATVDFVSGTAQPFVELFDGTNLASLTSTISNWGYFQVPGGFSYPVQAGHVYSISVGTVGAQRGEFTVRLNPVAPPVNDDFANALTVTGSNPTLAGSLYNATREPGETTPNAPWGTVWYRWTAPASGHVLIDSSGIMASSVYLGNSVTSLTPVYEQGFDQYLPEFNVVAGTTYNIAVMSYLPGWFGFGLTLTPAP